MRRQSALTSNGCGWSANGHAIEGVDASFELRADCSRRIDEKSASFEFAVLERDCRHLAISSRERDGKHYEEDRDFKRLHFDLFFFANSAIKTLAAHAIKSTVMASACRDGCKAAPKREATMRIVTAKGAKKLRFERAARKRAVRIRSESQILRPCDSHFHSPTAELLETPLIATTPPIRNVDFS